MAIKEVKELKKYSGDELQTKIRGAQKELFESRMKSKTGQLENVAQIWKLRKTIARMKTLQSQTAVKK